MEGAELEEYRRREKEKETETARIKQEQSRKSVLLLSVMLSYEYSDLFCCLLIIAFCREISYVSFCLWTKFVACG